jgi:hypothetical protein
MDDLLATSRPGGLSCADVDDLLAAYALGAAGSSAAPVERHLESCRCASDDLAGLRRTIAALPAPVPLPPTVWERVAERL